MPYNSVIAQQTSLKLLYDQTYVNFYGKIIRLNFELNI